METKVYNRKLKTLVIEKQFKKSYLDFLYKTIMGRIMLKLIFSTKGFSKLYSVYLSSKKSVKKIQPFIEKYGIDMSDYRNKNYSSFNDFFAREIKPDKRPYPSDCNTLISVADAKLMVYKINKELKMQIKNSTYSISELLKDDMLGKSYHNGTCLVFRLTVDDYHRYHYIDDGHVECSRIINGVLHTVGPISSERYNVYIENQREVSVLKTENLGEFIQIEVGAILVGKITNHKAGEFKRGDEKGYFSFGGSTVLLLFKEGVIKVDSDILKFSKQGIEVVVRMGEKIGGIIK